MNGVQAVTFIDGFSKGFDESAAELPWVGFCYDRVEPARGWLDTLQTLVRTMRTGARTVTVALPHRSLNDALSNGWLSPIGEVPVDTHHAGNATEWRGMVCAFSKGCRPGRSRLRPKSCETLRSLSGTNQASITCLSQDFQSLLVSVDVRSIWKIEIGETRKYVHTTHFFCVV